MTDKKRTGCLKPILIGMLVVLLLLFIFISLGLPGVATKIANDQLPQQLGTEATLGKIDINLLGGRFGIQSLTLQQPEDFKDLGETLLTLEKLEAHVPLASAVKQDPLVVNQVTLSGLDLQLISNTNAVLNVTTLGPAPKEEPEPVPSEEPTDSPAAPPPPIWIKNILLEGVTVAFRDEAKDWDIEMSDIDFDITDIQVMAPQGDGPGRVRGHVHFQSEKANGRLQLHAKIGVITPDRPEIVPTVQIAMGLIGFDLDLVEPFLTPSPSVAKAAFGGSGFDFHLFMQIDPPAPDATQQIEGRFELITDKNQNTSDKLGGTTAEPVLPFTTLFADILGNQFGRVFQTGGNIAQGGLEAGKTVGKTGVAAVKGVGKTVGGFAGGVFRTAKGVATLNKDDALGGMSDATVGTVKNAAGTVADTAGTAGSGVMDTAGTVTGSDDVKAWWENVEQRQAEFEKTALAWFEENPFPTKAPDASAQAETEPETSTE